MLSHRKREARHLQEVLEAELDRVGAGPSRSSPEGEFIWVDEVDVGDKSGSTGARVLMSVPAWWVDEFPPGREWRGSLEEALERLRRVANDAGIGVACATLWPDDPCARLWGELDRVGASAWRAELAGETEWVRLAGDQAELSLRAQGNSSRALSWRGPVTGALEHLAGLPDGAGLAGVWTAFRDARRIVAPPTWVDVEVGDDDTKELRLLLERELWRIGVSEDQAKSGVYYAIVSASEDADPPEFRVREGWPLGAGHLATTEVWSGPNRDFAHILEGIPDDAGFGGFWLPFMGGEEPDRRVFSELVRLAVWTLDYANEELEDEEDVDAELDASGSELTLVGDTRFWTGPVADALKRTATLPDRAGHRRFWELFPDTTGEEEDEETDFDTDLDAAVKRFESGDVTAAASRLGVLYRRSSGVAERKQIDEVVDQMLHYLPRKEQKAFKTGLALEAEGTSRETP